MVKSIESDQIDFEIYERVLKILKLEGSIDSEPVFEGSIDSEVAGYLDHRNPHLGICSLSRECRHFPNQTPEVCLRYLQSGWTILLLLGWEMRCYGWKGFSTN